MVAGGEVTADVEATLIELEEEKNHLILLWCYMEEQNNILCKKIY
jgi:hypothetical protein